MKTINIYFNSSEKNFMKDCKEKKITTKTVKQGEGCKRCTGPYKYRWIETDRPNYDMYILYLKQGISVDVFFYSEDDRKRFLEELAEKIQFKEISNFHSAWYYKMENLYGVEIKA